MEQTSALEATIAIVASATFFIVKPESRTIAIFEEESAMKLFLLYFGSPSVSSNLLGRMQLRVQVMLGFRGMCNVFPWQQGPLQEG